MKTSKLNLSKKTVSNFAKATTNNKFWATSDLTSLTTPTGIFGL